jgi:hypothetical protein
MPRESAITRAFIAGKLDASTSQTGLEGCLAPHGADGDQSATNQDRVQPQADFFTCVQNSITLPRFSEGTHATFL